MLPRLELGAWRDRIQLSEKRSVGTHPVLTLYPIHSGLFAKASTRAQFKVL